MRIRTRLIWNYIAIVLVILPAISLYLNHALSSGSGVADRYSTTIDTSLRYYALPAKGDHLQPQEFV